MAASWPAGNGDGALAHPPSRGDAGRRRAAPRAGRGGFATRPVALSPTPVVRRPGRVANPLLPLTQTGGCSRTWPSAIHTGAPPRDRADGAGPAHSRQWARRHGRRHERRTVVGRALLVARACRPRRHGRCAARLCNTPTPLCNPPTAHLDARHCVTYTVETGPNTILDRRIAGGWAPQSRPRPDRSPGVYPRTRWHGPCRAAHPAARCPCPSRRRALVHVSGCPQHRGRRGFRPPPR